MKKILADLADAVETMEGDDFPELKFDKKGFVVNEARKSIERGDEREMLISLEDLVEFVEENMDIGDWMDHSDEDGCGESCALCAARKEIARREAK
jgi:hypothetical protein